MRSHSRIAADMRRRLIAYYRGVGAEWYCMAWLVIKGYSILANRYKHAQGEIDIIALRGRMIMCIEVKARANRQAALESITSEKRYRTQQAAQAFLASHKKFLQHDLRFDVMVVTSGWRIYHLQNAWSLS